MAEINGKRLVAEFLSLVKVGSPSLEEKNISRIITRKLSSLGIKYSIDSTGEKIGGQTGNIYARIKGSVKSAPAFFLNAHLDTVRPGRGIQPFVKAGYIHSRGENILAADDKAGVAIIMEVLRVLKEKKIPHGDMEIIFTVAEEIGLKGARYFNIRRLKSKFGYVLDGGRHLPRLITAAPSQITFTATFLGKAAHAGIHPENGINAIQTAAAAISKIKVGRLDKETTANIGRIEGGLATNIVPEKVLVKGEARSHNYSKLTREISEIKNIFSKTAAGFGAGLKWTDVEEYRSYKLASGSAAVRAFVKAAKNRGYRAEFAATGGGSDANIFNFLGRPAAVIPTGMENPHSPNEKLNVKNFVAAAELTLELVKTVAGDCSLLFENEESVVLKGEKGAAPSGK